MGIKPRRTGPVHNRNSHFHRFLVTATRVTLLYLLLHLLNFTSVLCAHSNATIRLTNSSLTPNPGANDSLGCERCRSGESLQSPVVKPSQADCVSGHFQAILTSTQCECDFVCARESRQACRLSLTTDALNANQILCDSTLNLKCNPNTNLCEGMCPSLRASPRPNREWPFT